MKYIGWFSSAPFLEYREHHAKPKKNTSEASEIHLPFVSKESSFSAQMQPRSAKLAIFVDLNRRKMAVFCWRSFWSTSNSEKFDRENDDRPLDLMGIEPLWYLWGCLKTGYAGAPPPSRANWPFGGWNDDRPLDFGVPYSETKPHIQRS